MLSQEKAMKAQDAKTMIFICVLNVFASWAFLDLSWLNMASKTPPRRLQDASKTAQDASKRLQDRLRRFQDTSKTPPRLSKTPPRGVQDASKTLKISSKTAKTSPRGLQMRPRPPISVPKCSYAVPKSYFPARFMPSPCQFSKYARDVCPPWPSTMADCQIRGR